MAQTDAMAAEIVKEGISSVAEFLEFIANMAATLGSRSYSSNNVSDNKAGFGELMEHSRKCGYREDAIKSDRIPAEKADMYERMLKYHNIPYVCVPSKDKNGNDEFYFCTRDKDSALVSKIQDMYLNSYDRGCREVGLSELLDNNRGGTLYSYDNLTPAELEVFRHHVTTDEPDIRYAVEINRNGTCNIHFHERDEGEIKNILARTAFELSGANGHRYRNGINEWLKKRDRFRDDMIPSDDSTLYIVDTEDPKKFITVDSNKFIKHEVKATYIDKEHIQHNLEAPEDKASEPEPVSDRDGLYDAVLELSNPVILTAEEIKGLYKGLDDKNAVITEPETAENFLEKLMEFKTDKLDSHEIRNRRLEKDFIPDILNGANDVTVIRLPQDKRDEVVRAFETKALERVAMVGDLLAYAGADREVVDDTLAQTLYSGLDQNVKIQNMVRYEERGTLEIDNPDKAQYIINLDVPKFQFCLNKDGLEVTDADTGRITHLADRGADNFNEQVKSVFLGQKGQALNNVVVLTAEEYASPDRNEIIEKRNPANNNEVAKSFVTTDEREMELFLNGMHDTPRTSEAYKNVSDKWSKPRMHTVQQNATYKVDRDITEKVAEHTTEQKTVVDGNPSQQPSSRTVNSSQVDFER